MLDLAFDVDRRKGSRFGIFKDSSSGQQTCYAVLVLQELLAAMIQNELDSLFNSIES